MRILIADDDRLIRLILVRSLEAWGHEVLPVEDGHAALDVLTGPDAPHLAILDWSMPGFTGIEVCERIRALALPRYLYLMLLTSHERQEDLVRAFEAGADDFVTKPLQPLELEARLRAATRILDLHEDLGTELAQRRCAESELERLNQTLEDRVTERTAEVEQLLAQKNRFVNQLAHDLRTPLTPLVALLPRVAECVEGEQCRRMIDLAVENASYMHALVEKTVELAHLSAAGHRPRRETFDIAPMIEGCLELEHPAYAEVGLEAVNRVMPPRTVHADPVLMKQVVGNLLGNCRKYSSGPGTVTIDAFEEDETLVITLADEGIGMTPEQADCVFDEFYRADTSRHDLASVGLGLSICRRIMESHGGTIRVETTRPGEGTVMRLELPVTAPDGEDR